MARTSDRGFDVVTFLRWAEVVGDALGAARAEIDALNVFPVPDADTGTNLFLTWEAALQAATAASTAAPQRAAAEAVPAWPEDPVGSVGSAGQPVGSAGELSAAANAFVDGALTGARGNSGVILAQLLRSSLPVLTTGLDSSGALVADVLADALALSARAARKAVARPQEGTMLSVADAAAHAATAAAVATSTAERRQAVHAVLRAACAAAREALARTPEQLEVLARRGVVDAGGRGLVVVLEATERALTGRWQAPASLPGPGRSHSIPVPVAPAAGDLRADGPAYEVMYLLEAADEQVPLLQARLDRIGESVVVVGGQGLWNVHVHADDVGLALQAALEVGRPHRISVTHFVDQATSGSRTGELRPTPGKRMGRTLVAMAAGPGLHKLFTEAGAHVVRGSADVRPPTAAILEALRASDSTEVVLLPNDHTALPPAEAAAAQARREGVRVAVVPTRTQVQGLAALAVHDPGRDFDDDVVAMSAAAGHTRQGAVTLATGRAMTMAGPCEPGDALGVVDGDFVVVGDDLLTVALQVLERLLAGGGELVTVVTGAASPDGAGTDLAAAVRIRHPEVDTLVYDGGQERYLLLLGVE